MDKLEEFSKKFYSLKKILNNSDIHQLCSQPFKSIILEIKGKSKEFSSSSKLPKSINNNNNNDTNIMHKANNKKDEFYKNLLTSLESSKKKQKPINLTKTPKNDNKSHSPSINDMNDSPKILEDNNHVGNNLKNDFNNFNNNTIPLNEDEEENNQSSNNLHKSNKSLSKIKSNENISFYIIDKTDKKLNILDKIKEYLNKYDVLLSSLREKASSIKEIDNFYYKNKESFLIKYIMDNNIINMDTIKKLIHLFFNVLSKIFSTFTKETDYNINLCFNDISNIINLILDLIKIIKNFIKNNGDNVDITFLKEMKIIGNYCLYVMVIKKYNYEYMIEIENKKDNDKKNMFFMEYMKYLKIVKKIKNIFKDNSLFMKHFLVQPNMINFIDLLEMNRKIINFQLNVNYKK